MQLSTTYITFFYSLVGCNPATTCSGQGTCNNDGSCTCNDGFSGTNCSTTGKQIDQIH